MRNIDLDNKEFTFYGDLLGISNLYQIETTLAKQKLDIFYNNVFNNFKDMVLANEMRGFLFSDSLFITSKKLKTILIKLGDLYEELFERNIFIRGAIVSGTLDFDPRIQLDNLPKMLPSTDALFRANSLENSVNGMRLLIEKDLAKQILPEEWLTEDLYKNNIILDDIDQYDFRRKIILTSEWNAYEYLWMCHLNPSEIFGPPISELMERLNRDPYEIIDERILQLPKAVRVHLEQTKELFERTGKRWKITYDTFNKGNNSVSNSP
ncbi:MAG: hypothetical protein PHP10_00940 [Candidatus Omnitrophica bacterium]|nr:hypothetical protein [Candidatus Omnitrophota bacterium]